MSKEIDAKPSWWAVGGAPGAALELLYRMATLCQNADRAYVMSPA